MVKVLPEPVCPYAMIVALKPSSTRATSGFPTASKTSACDASPSKLLSSENSIFLSGVSACPMRTRSGAPATTSMSGVDFSLFGVRILAYAETVSVAPASAMISG